MLSARPHAGQTGVPSVSSRCSSWWVRILLLRHHAANGWVVARFVLHGAATFERSLITPEAPGYAGEFVGEGDGSDVVASPAFDIESPGAQVIGMVSDLAGS